jgi:hypothetical protein
MEVPLDLLPHARPAWKRKRGADHLLHRALAPLVSRQKDTAVDGKSAQGAGRQSRSAQRWNLPDTSPLLGERHHPRRCEGGTAAMYSVFYIIGVVVVVLAILSLLGLA